MKHFNRYSLAMLPLLSILAMSPSTMQIETNFRGIASLESKGQLILPDEQFKPTAKPEAETRPVTQLEETKPEVKGEEPELRRGPHQHEYRQKVTQGEEPKKEDKPEVKTEEPELRRGPHQHEYRQKVTEGEEPKKEDKPEVKGEEPKKEDKPVVAEGEPKKEDKPEVKGEEPKKEEEKKDGIVVKDEKKEDKKEEKKEEVAKDDKKDEKCEQDEKVQALTKQIETLMADQKQIMQTMMSMTQMMMTMMQQQQNQNPWQPYMHGPTMQSPYQYAPQQTAGNWVYHPQGFQPSQINIFAQPQVQQQMPQQGGIFPDQMHMQQSNSWNLRPQMTFENAQPMAMQPSAGAFGGDVGFNMGGQVPMVSQFR